MLGIKTEMGCANYLTYFVWPVERDVVRRTTFHRSYNSTRTAIEQGGAPGDEAGMSKWFV